MIRRRNLWPLGIFGAFAAFALGTASLVGIACSQRTDLVSADYYEQEIAYQQRLDQLDRTRRLPSQASVSYDTGSCGIKISVPIPSAGPMPVGRVQLYRPSAAALDRQAPLEPGPDGVQTLDARGLAPGLWKVRVTWRFQGQTFFMEQSVLLGRGK